MDETAMSDLRVRLPFVSVIIPIRNEEKYIGKCLDSFLNQDYESDSYEIIVVDGESTDDSLRIAREYAEQFNRLTILTNSYRTTPQGLNIGIQKAQGDLCIVFSAHAYASQDFISESVRCIQESGADCVGGQVVIVSENTFARSVAMAMISPFGMGNVHFRSSNKSGFVDTVAFGAYRIQIFERIGLFDNELPRNQDDEFNYRLTKSGGKIYFDPQIRSYAFSRSSLKRLAAQYSQWGFYKPLVFLKLHTRPRLRHLVPAAFVLCVLVLFVISVWSFWALFVLGGIGALYIFLAAVFSAKQYDGKNILASLLMPFVCLTMHINYGMGFIAGLVYWPLKSLSRTKQV
jgi:glycosyltransferase involved in cell wall biosynthesis